MLRNGYEPAFNLAEMSDATMICAAGELFDFQLARVRPRQGYAH